MRWSSISSESALVHLSSLTSFELGDRVIVATIVSPGRSADGAVSESLVAKERAAMARRAVVMRDSVEWSKCRV